MSVGMRGRSGGGDEGGGGGGGDRGGDDGGWRGGWYAEGRPAARRAVRERWRDATMHGEDCALSKLPLFSISKYFANCGGDSRAQTR